MPTSVKHAPGQSALKILPLTSARFFAALYVVFYHWWARIPAHRESHDFITRFISFGYVSVSFFFMLSGFILAIVYLKDDKPVPLRKFFMARFARIYPLYVVSLLMDLPHFWYTRTHLLHMSMGLKIGTIVATFAMVHAWSPYLLGLNSPSWSLAVEAFFYLLFPVLGVALERLRLRTSMLLAVVVYVAGLAFVWLLGRDQQIHTPLPYLFVFVLGIQLAKLFRWLNESEGRRLALDRAAPWMLLLSIAAFVAIPAAQIPLPEAMMIHGALAPLFGMVLLALASGNRWIGYVFSPNWLVILGEASFALYLIHDPVGLWMRTLMVRYSTPMVFCYVGIAVGLSVLSLLYWETPTRLWILRREKLRSQENMVTSSVMQ